MKLIEEYIQEDKLNQSQKLSAIHTNSNKDINNDLLLVKDLNNNIVDQNELKTDKEQVQSDFAIEDDEMNYNVD